MNKNIKSLVVIAGLFLTNLAIAQKGTYFVSVQGGTNLIEGKENYVTDVAKFGGSVKAGYIYNFNSIIGVGTGVEYIQYNTESAIDDATYTTNLVDNTNSAFVYKVTTSGYKEQHKLTAFQVPLFLQIKTPISQSNSFYCRFGGKLVIPSKYEINAQATSISASGFYPDFNLEINDLPSNGFGTNTNYNESGEYETKLAYMASAEAGLDFKITSKTSIYFGVFVDYGLSDVIDNEKVGSLIGYNNNSIDNREAKGIYNTSAMKSIPMSVGATLGFSFGK